MVHGRKDRSRKDKVVLICDFRNVFYRIPFSGDRFSTNSIPSQEFLISKESVPLGSKM